ncbi:DNA-directed RNA polymerase III, subunit Rpc31 [Dactylonectria macrodidyma]|uniref:DNA-directed RNA polymerase III subunit n=1 Tax=Dactylonectria macrodidyma TaxID=307937 RepID=A0A9P9FSC8_9HYPO|nr:DNA-directed RNA polymerase III, subunit Rpc31 [Dactylonectria macrodidyma]
MSRGGRGGGRGGRGGGRGGRPNVPWDTGDEPDARPSELFPPYLVPTQKDLSLAEKRGIQHLLLLRHQIHGGPLYTSKRTLVNDPTAPRKLYGQAQMNARYDVKNKASLDPFTAVPTYSSKFIREERALPDWSHRPVCRELFPAELLDTIDAAAATSTTQGTYKRRRLELTSISALPSAEEAFGMEGDDEGQGRNLLERLEAMKDDEAGEGVELEDDEGLEEDEQDEAYDDEDAGDYDAENYFDNGDEFGEDYGDDGEGEGTF